MKKIFSIVLMVLMLTSFTSAINNTDGVNTTDLWSDVYGTVLINGENAPINTIIYAYDSNNVLIGRFTTSTEGQYGFMHLYGDDPNTPLDEGATLNDLITFKINDINAGTINWPGNNIAPIMLNLEINNNDPTPQPEQELQISQTKVNSIELNHNLNKISIRNSNTLNTQINLNVLQDETNLIIKTELIDTETNQKVDEKTSNEFDAFSNIAYTKHFELTLPDDFKPSYKLKITIANSNGILKETEYPINLEKHIEPTQRVIDDNNPISIPKINMNGGEYLNLNEDLRTSMTIENTGNKDLKDVKISVTIPELDMIAKAGPFDVKGGDQITKRLTLMNYDEITPGTYYIRYTVQSNDYKRTKYREVVFN